MKSRARLRITHGPETTIAVLEVEGIYDEWTRFVGDAKKHPKDKSDESVGEAYALSRVFLEAHEYFSALADNRLIANEKYEAVNEKPEWILGRVTVERIEA